MFIYYKHAFLYLIFELSKELLRSLFVLVILGYFFLAIKAEISFSAFMSFANFYFACRTKMGNTANMIISHFFLAIVTEVSNIADVTCPNFFFALRTKSCYTTNVTISNLFFTIMAKEC